jgi:hypothetical protein
MVRTPDFTPRPGQADTFVGRVVGRFTMPRREALRLISDTALCLGVAALSEDLPAPSAPPASEKPGKSPDQLRLEGLEVRKAELELSLALTATIGDPRRVATATVFNGLIRSVASDSEDVVVTAHRPFMHVPIGGDPLTDAYIGMQIPHKDGISVTFTRFDPRLLEYVPADSEAPEGAKPLIEVALHAGPAPAPFNTPNSDGSLNYIAYVCHDGDPTQLDPTPPAFSSAMK